MKKHLIILPYKPIIAALIFSFTFISCDKDAAVSNFRQEIVAVASNETPNLTEAKLYQSQQLKASTLLTILGVRVSFDVLPKSGTAPVRIIKTFKADLRNS